MNTFLVLWLFLSSGLPSSPGEQWRLVYRDGTVEAFQSAPHLPLERREGLSHAWVWSDSAAPRRIEADRIGEPRLSPDRSRLQVHVQGAHTLLEARLIAGPLEMWEEVPEDLMPSWPCRGKAGSPCPWTRGGRGGRGLRHEAMARGGSTCRAGAPPSPWLRFQPPA